MLHRRVRVLSGITSVLLVAGVGASSGALAASPTMTGVPKASALVSVKAHRLGSTVAAAHKAVAFKALGVDGVPTTGVAAVVVKLTASKPAAAGNLVAYPTGAKKPAVLSVSFTARHDATATVVVV